MKQNLTRSKNITFRVTQNEYDMIYRRMGQTGVKNLRAYLLKMAIDGEVITIQLNSVEQCNRLLSNIANNVNQLAKKANSGGSVNAQELREVQAKLNEVWEQQRVVIDRVTNLVEAV